MSHRDPFMSLLQYFGDPIIMNMGLWSWTMTIRENDDINTRVNKLTDEIQEWCENNSDKSYAEWYGDLQKWV